MSRESERPVRFESLSGIPVEPLYTPEASLGADWSYTDKLGKPGDYPFTRGVHPTMYRGRLWTMRIFAGFGSPEDTNGGSSTCSNMGKPASPPHSICRHSWDMTRMMRDRWVKSAGKG